MVWYAKESKLLDFLHKVSRDPKLQEAIKRDPRGTMKAEGLSDKEVETLHAQDHEGVLRDLLHRIEDG